MGEYVPSEENKMVIWEKMDYIITYMVRERLTKEVTFEIIQIIAAKAKDAFNFLGYFNEKRKNLIESFYSDTK